MRTYLIVIFSLILILKNGIPLFLDVKTYVRLDPPLKLVSSDLPVDPKEEMTPENRQKMEAGSFLRRRIFLHGFNVVCLVVIFWAGVTIHERKKGEEKVIEEELNE